MGAHMAQPGVGDRPHLRGGFHVLNRRRLVIGLAALIGAGLALTGSLVISPTYSAGAVVLVPSPASSSPQRTLADELQLARGDAVRKAAVSALGYQAAASVSSSSTADVLTFTAHSTDRAHAAAIANAYANAFITQQRAEHPGPDKGPTVVKAAVTPASTPPRTVIRNGVLGFLAGTVVGIAIAFLVDHLDESVTSRQVAEQACGGRPVVGLIPNVRAWRRNGTPLALAEDAASGVAEAYRTLGTSVQFVGTGAPNRVVAVTSPIAGDGKTTAVANLAVYFARAGKRVIVLSADLRRPRIHELFGLGNDTGLTSLFSGQSGLADILLPVPGEPRLRVIPSGPIPPNPAEILSVDAMSRLCGVLRENADMVLIDCPPVLPVTDALLVSQMVDGVHPGGLGLHYDPYRAGPRQRDARSGSRTRAGDSPQPGSRPGTRRLRVRLHVRRWSRGRSTAGERHSGPAQPGAGNERFPPRHRRSEIFQAGRVCTQSAQSLSFGPSPLRRLQPRVHSYEDLVQVIPGPRPGAPRGGILARPAPIRDHGGWGTGL